MRCADSKAHLPAARYRTGELQIRACMGEDIGLNEECNGPIRFLVGEGDARLNSPHASSHSGHPRSDISAHEVPLDANSSADGRLRMGEEVEVTETCPSPDLRCGEEVRTSARSAATQQVMSSAQSQQCPQHDLQHVEEKRVGRTLRDLRAAVSESG